MLYRISPTAEVPEQCRGGVVSIGNFDGVHRGHVQLADCMTSLAREAGVPAVAFTFDPHPVSLLRPEQSPTPLTWTERKATLLQEHGVDHVLVIETNRRLLDRTADEFFHVVIRQGLNARALVEGPNFGFGRDRSGSIATLQRLCDAAAVRLEVVDPLHVAGEVVSSTRVRRTLAAGDVANAAILLGRPHRVRGRVGTGAGRGKTIGFPTANLRECESFVPAFGVYAARANIAAGSFPAAVHVGPNVTFGETTPTLEAHLIGYSGELGDTVMELDFLERLRGTTKFASAAELVEQLRRDVERSRQIAEKK